MTKVVPWLLCVFLLFGSPGLVRGQDASAKQPQPIPQSQAPGQHTATIEQFQSLKGEVEQLRATVATQSQELAQQKGVIDTYSKKTEASNTPWFTLAGAILAAAIAGIVAIINSNKQAAQQR